MRWAPSDSGSSSQQKTFPIAARGGEGGGVVGGASTVRSPATADVGPTITAFGFFDGLGITVGTLGSAFLSFGATFGGGPVFNVVFSLLSLAGITDDRLLDVFFAITLRVQGL